MALGGAEPAAEGAGDAVIGESGRYAFWAPSGASPFKMAASANGWIPQTTRTSIKGGKTTTVNFTPRPTSC